jgi:hypothetical protein
VVTQRDVHKDNSRQFIDVAKAHGLKGKTILLLGGPRVDHKLAMELGSTRVRPGTKPSDVANYIVHALLKKMGKEPEDLHFRGRARMSVRSVLRLRMSRHDAHYGGNLVDGARMLGLFGDVATELCILHDGDEGLFRPTTR